MTRGVRKRLRAGAQRVLGQPVAALLLWLLRLSQRKAGAAIVYHGLAPKRGDPEREILPAVGVRSFDAHMRHLARHYRVVPATTLPAAVQARCRGERFPVAVTFDDDLPSHTEFALPSLRRYGLRATFFLTGASLDGPSSFWWERLQRALDAGAVEPAELGLSAVTGGARAGRAISAAVEAFSRDERERLGRLLLARLGGELEATGLRAEGVRELVEAGMEIGFHTARHEPLTTLSDDELAAALLEGADRLAELAGSSLEGIAYPHGRADSRVAEAARSAGFVCGFTMEHGSVKPGDDPLLLCRMDPSWTTSIGQLALHLVRALFARDGAVRAAQ